MKPFLSHAFCICSVLIISQGASAQQTTFWWNNAVFYEIFVRSFYDANGDGNGDLQGVIQKLGYLKDLGVDALYLMPVMPSASYHGYDVTDYYNVNPDYGSRAIFKQLTDSAHQKGMKIIIDYVMNHTSDQHPWFVSSGSTPSSPYRSWYVWRQNNPGFLGPWGEQVWYPLNGSYYYGVFWGGMPDLNYRDTGVQNRMLDIAGYWLDSMHVDGFRLDAIQYLVEDGDTLFGTPQTHDYLAAFRSFYTVHNPQAFTVGEVTASTDKVVPYVGPAQLNSCFEFDLAAAIISSVNAKDPTAVSDKTAQVVASYPFLQYATFLSNHDQNRVFDQFTHDRKRMALAAGMLLTLPGIPFIYYGEEIAMTGSGPDSAKRTPMQWTSGTNAGFTTTAAQPWEPINADFATYNVQSLQSDSGSLWHWYQKLISARHALPALRLGTYSPVQTNLSTVYSFARYAGGQLVLAFHNFDSVTAVVSAATLQSSGFGSGKFLPMNFLTQATANELTVNEGGGFTNYNPNITLAPYGAAILAVNNQTGAVSPVRTETRPCIRIKSAKNFLTIDYASLSQGRCNAEIVDPLGKIVYRSTASEKGGSITFVKTSWPAGLYIVQIIKEGKNLASKKIAVP